MSEHRTAWGYLEEEAASEAPISDNPSGLYCPACRGAGLSHCSEPEWCGGMRLMRPAPTDPAPQAGVGETGDRR